PFALRRLAMLMPWRRAISDRVSPRLTRTVRTVRSRLRPCADEPARDRVVARARGAGEAAAEPGTLSNWPDRTELPRRPFARRRLSTVVPLRRAMSQRVSPRPTRTVRARAAAVPECDQRTAICAGRRLAAPLEPAAPGMRRLLPAATWLPRKPLAERRAASETP